MGAWIETSVSVACATWMRLVAPYVGAWIETLGERASAGDGSESHPTWVRGLKLHTDEGNAGNQ